MTNTNKPLSLKTLQDQFAQSQQYQPHGLETEIQAEQFSVEQRLQVYRNNFIISLSEVLTATYPACLAVVGEECFLQIARQHVLQHALTSGDVSDYGEHFDSTIAAIPSITEAVPYLSDLARLEWQIDRLAAQGVPSQDFPLAALSELLTSEGEEALASVILTPHGALFQSPYAVVTLWQMITNDQIESLDLNQPEQGWIQYREKGATLLALDENSMALIQLSLEQRPLAEANEGMLTMLSELIQNHVFSAFHLTYQCTGRE